MADGVGRCRRLTATGNVSPHVNGGTCWGGVLTPGSAAASVVVREGGGSGTVILTVTAVANGVSIPIAGPFRFEGQLHATLSGTGAEVSFLI